MPFKDFSAGVKYTAKPSSRFKFLNRDRYRPSREDYDTGVRFDPTEDWDWQNKDQLGPQGEPLPINALGWRPTGDPDYGPGLKGWANKVSSEVRQAYERGAEEGLRIEGLSKVALESTTPEGTIEKLESKPEPHQAQLFGMLEGTKEMAEQIMWGAFEGLGQLAKWGDQLIGASADTARNIYQGKDPNWEENWRAGRLSYAAAIYPAIADEMHRNIKAGMRTDIAAQEISARFIKDGRKWAMWAQLAGEVFIDPINLLTVWGKAKHAMKLADTAQDAFRVIKNPVVRELVEGLAKVGDDADAISKIRKLTESQQGLRGVVEHADEIGKTGQALGEWSTSYQLGQLNAGGKLSHLGNRVGEIMNYVVNNVDNTDEALEIFRAMLLSADPDKAKAAQGVAGMMKFADPHALFSDAGRETTAMMIRAADKYPNWLDDLARASQKGESELVELLFRRMDDIGEDMYPSVKKMLEAENKVKAGEQVTDAVRALADKAENIPSYVRWASKAHKGAQVPVGPLNKFFANVYMGWNPGFAVRNYANNTLTVFADQGIGALFNAEKKIELAESLNGGVIAGQFGYETGQAAITSGRKITKKVGIIEALFKGKAPFTTASGNLELKAAKQVIGTAYLDTWDKGVGAMVKDVTPKLRAGGFSDDLIKRLPTYIEENAGDYKKVVEAIRKDMKLGTIDLFSSQARIHPKFKGFLGRVNKWDDYTKNVLNASSKDEAVAALDKIFGDIDEIAGAVYQDGTYVTTDYGKFLKAAQKEGFVGPASAYAMDVGQQMQRDAVKAADLIYREALTEAGRVGMDNLGQITKNIGETGEWGAKASKQTQDITDLTLDISKRVKAGGSLDDLWIKGKQLFDGIDKPTNLNRKQFLDILWHQKRIVINDAWRAARTPRFEEVRKFMDIVKDAGGNVTDDMYRALDASIESADTADKLMVGKNGFLVTEDVLEYGSRSTKIAHMANKAGIETATDIGVSLDKKTLRIINKYANAEYKSLEEVPLSVAAEAFGKKQGLEVVDFAADLQKAEPIIPPLTGDGAPSMSRALFEQADEIADMKAMLLDDIAQNFGRKGVPNPVKQGELNKLSTTLKQRLAETRLVSSRVAQAQRDFTLLNYGQKTYWDQTLAYIYPYHFWYKGTYKNWLTRFVTRPGVLAGYAKYKNMMAVVHSDMPEWWKYNINTNDLPGIDTENPLYFNLESTLWPLNGLTNVDFNDPNKRINTWTYMLDYMNRFGPSTWSPLNMITGLALHKQGETEAGDRWMGRLFPQSQVIKAGASLMGASNFETDPFVNFLQDGLDPYERRRVSRAFATMEHLYSEEELMDAAYSKEGPIWDEAVRRAVSKRAWPTVTSYMFGVGFKGRTAQDMEIDEFYSDYHRLWTMNPNLTSSEFKEAMDDLRTTYPFMDAVLLSRRGGVDRDRGLAYNVLSRIPPAHSDDFAKAAGIDPELLSRFYEDKGRIDTWKKSDYQRFMSGIMDMAAILEVPDDMTRKEWTAARNAYSKMMDEGKEEFGKDIWEGVDAFYAFNAVDKDKAQEYLDNNPHIADAMDWKSERILNSQLLNAYYGGAGVLEKYMRGQMYGAIEDELGSEIFDIIGEYETLKTYGTEGAKRDFYREYKKDIRRYYEMIYDEWQPEITRRVAEFGAYMPDMKDATIRPDADFTTIGGQGIEGMDAPQRSMEDWQRMMPPELYRVALDFFLTGENIPEAAEYRLERMANDLGYQYPDDLLQDFGTSLYAYDQ